MTEEELKILLYNIYLKDPPNLFLEFMNECEKIYNKPINNMYDLKHNNNKKIKGNIFEQFCVIYLKYIKNYSSVWLLNDIPTDIIEMLSMRKRDMGIDIIAENNNNFYAIQCKYKNKKSATRCLSWKNLSTFYALCSKTGPWEKNIVMTTCKNINHQGLKTEKDLSYCLGTFSNIEKEDWIKMCNISKGYTLSDKDAIVKDAIVKDIIIKDNIIKDNLSEKDKIRYLRLLKFG